jgi:hypothetical protein
MWFGTGNAPTNYNTDTFGTVETGLKVHIRGGADILPSGPGGANGEQTYSAPAGEQSATRALWNLDFTATTAANNDLVGTPSLSAEDFKMQITASGPGFINGPQTVMFNLDPSTHVWVDAANPTIGFGGDDFTQPGASAALQAHVAENSLNIDFILPALGVSLADATQAGNSYDVKLAGFNGSHMDVMTHDVINLVPSV